MVTLEFTNRDAQCLLQFIEQVYNEKQATMDARPREVVEHTFCQLITRIRKNQERAAAKHAGIIYIV